MTLHIKATRLRNKHSEEEVMFTITVEHSACHADKCKRFYMTLKSN